MNMNKVLNIIALLAIYFFLVWVLNKADVGYFPIGTITITSLLIVFIITGIVLRYTKYKHHTKKLYILGIISFVALFTSFSQTKINMKRTETRANEIIAKLSLFKKETGGYPKDLILLVPSYLNALPQPSFKAAGEFIYETECYIDTLNNEMCNNFILIYYGPLGMEAKYTSKKGRWEYDD